MSDEKNPLSIVSLNMLLWVLFVIAVYIFIVWRERPLFTVNEKVIPKGYSFEYWGLLFFLVTVIVAVVLQSRRVQADTARLFFIIFSSIVLIALAVYLTGGFLDSPFSGASALYLGFFIVMFKRGVYRKSNLIFIFITILLMLGPYIYLWRKNINNMFIVNWVDEPSITWGRVLMSLLLSMAAAVFGDMISNAVSNTNRARLY